MMFRILVQPDRQHKYTFERRLEAAGALAERCLRSHVTLPLSVAESEDPGAHIASGERLAPVACAFRTCK